MFFASDNSGPTHPQILEALIRVNTGHCYGYGNDDLTRAVTAQIREVFEAPQAEVWLVGTGTAANVLALSSMADPFQTVYCSRVAHIHEDEYNGFEFHSGGAKLTLVGDGDKMTPEALGSAIDYDLWRGQEPSQLGPLSLTQLTERGRVYTPGEVAALSSIAREHGLGVHMDGARFANAVTALDCTPAEITWRAGVDVLSFGGTKNGCMGVEAVVVFDPARTRAFGMRRHRAGQTFSKHRYLAAQMQAYLSDDLWLHSARAANDRGRRLAEGLRHAPGVEFRHDPQANMVFVTLPEATHARLQAAGAAYYHAPGQGSGQGSAETVSARLVCDWSIPEAEIDRFVAVAQGVAAAKWGKGELF